MVFVLISHGFFKIICFCKDGNIIELSVTFWKNLVIFGTFQNIVGLVIKDNNHPMFTSEVLDDSLSVTVYVKLLLLAQYYALCKFQTRLQKRKSWIWI